MRACDVAIAGIGSVAALRMRADRCLGHRIGSLQFHVPVAVTPLVMLVNVPLVAAPVHFAAM
jgi:hypothetical protein